MLCQWGTDSPDGRVTIFPHVFTSDVSYGLVTRSWTRDGWNGINYTYQVTNCTAASFHSHVMNPDSGWKTKWIAIGY